jgi:uncharacterized protein YdaU (DUF1376 family)
MHYYQFHIGDYKSHTHHLSLMEDLAFRRLLDHYYLHQSPIKQREIARQIGMRDFEQDVLTVLEEFFVSTDDGYINPRADKEIKAFVEHQATSAYGAFIRDNPTLKSNADKQSFVEHYMAGTIASYIESIKTSCVLDVPITPTSTTRDATNSQEPLPINQKPKKEKATVVARPSSIDEQLWNDWLVIRKKKDAPLTQTAWDLFLGQVNKANWTVDDAIKECCLRTWASFKAEWVAPKQSFAQQAADIARTTVPAQHTGPDPVLLKIAADREKATPMPAHIRQQINQVLRKV